MTLGRVVMRDATVAALEAGVALVEGRVHSGQVWPQTKRADFPALLVYAWRERKDNLADAGGPPYFRIACTMAIRGRSQAPTPAEVELELDELADQVEQALLANAAWVARFEKISSLETTVDVKAEGESAIGEVAIGLELQWTEQFFPAIADDLVQVEARVDAIEPADLAGDYPAEDGFPAPADPPRESGPDGRFEAGFSVTFDG